MLGFQLQLAGCKHEVMIAAIVDTWERPRVCFVDAGLKVLGRQDGVCLVVILPIRFMPGCCPRQHVGVDSVGKGDTASLCELYESPSSVFFLPSAKSSYCPCPVLVCVRAYFGIPITLNYKHIFLASLCYDANKLLVELFDLFVFVV